MLDESIEMPSGWYVFHLVYLTKAYVNTMKSDIDLGWMSVTPRLVRLDISCLSRSDNRYWSCTVALHSVFFRLSRLQNDDVWPLCAMFQGVRYRTIAFRSRSMLRRKKRSGFCSNLTRAAMNSKIVMGSLKRREYVTFLCVLSYAPSNQCLYM